MSAEGAELIPVAEREAELTLSDGVRLRSHLWYPRHGGPWPALLMRQPYGRAIASTVTYAHPRWWAEQGYLVVVQDVRGQGDSEGRFGGFVQEASDTAETRLGAGAARVQRAPRLLRLLVSGSDPAAGTGRCAAAGVPGARHGRSG